MFELEASLMCGNPLQLGRDVEQLERAGIDFFHIDVMDGHFVPNLALNFHLVEHLKSATNVPVDVHLMVSNPEDYVSRVRDYALSRICFHAEATVHPIRLASRFKTAGARVGVALNPSTPVSVLEYFVSEIDYILVMTVEPGFAGQKFLPAMLHKMDALRALLQGKRADIPIVVDGNLDVGNSVKCIERGATGLVGGTSSLFRRDLDVYSACMRFRNELHEALKLSALEAS